MTREDIIRMAREAFIKRGFWPNEVMWECWKDAWLQGASAERERLANVFDERDKGIGFYDPNEPAEIIRGQA